MTVQSSTQNDLFNLDLIRTYVDKELNPRFVERNWLKRQVEGKLADSACRFVLLTAEPGAGKSAFMAWMANQHPDWCRYFIRRDQRTPLGDVGAYSFLLQVGFQLAATHPDLFKQEQIKIVVEQRIGTATNSEIVGAEIGKMFASPFYEKVIQIQQQVTQSKDTNITGVRIGQFYATERDLPLDNLQFMALFDPAKAMMKQIQELTEHPNQQIVVLVDALDELRYQDSNLSLLKWLTNCPELPANLRFVLTCRPDDDLLRAFRGSQQGRIQEIKIEEEDPDVEKDLTQYTRFLIEAPEVNQALIEIHQDLDEFTDRAVTKANGNFGYLGAIGRAVDESIRQNEEQLLREILKLSELPDTLQDLYAFFLGKIKDAVAKEKVPVEDAEGEIGFMPVWSAVYMPILGILSVALEPLTPTQIQKLGLIQAEFDYVTEAIERLQQFLDQLGNCYRLYHSTLPEFFTSPKMKERKDYAYCYVDAIKQNQRIVNYYQAGKKIWAEVDLNKIAEDDYGRRHLAQHLVKADRTAELHTLMKLEKNCKNAWFTVKDDKGDTAGYLTDLELAWSQADAAEDLEPARIVGLQCRYSLIKTSINSLAGIPKELLVALVKHPNPCWKTAKAFAYARQIPDTKARAESLTALASQLPDFEPLKPQVSQSALEETLTINDLSDRIKVLIALFDKLPDALLPKALEAIQTLRNYYPEVLIALSNRLPGLLTEALEVALRLEGEEQRFENLIALSNKLPEALTYALETVLSIPFEVRNYAWYTHHLVVLANQQLPPDLFNKVLETSLAMECTETWIALATNSPPELLPKFLELASNVHGERFRAEILIALVNKFPDEVSFQALDAALIIQNEVDRANALIALSKKLPEVRSKALEAANSIQDQEKRVNALIDLSDNLPEIAQVLNAAIAIENEDKRVNALINLYDKLPSELLPLAFEAAIAIQNEKRRARALAKLYDKKLPSDLLFRALKVNQSIQDWSNRDRALMTLANRLPKKAMLKVLLANQFVDEYFYKYNQYKYSRFGFLVPCKWLFAVLSTLKSFFSGQSKASTEQILTVLAERFPEGYSQAIESELVTYKEFDRTMVLIALSNKFSNVLPKALEATLVIQNKLDRRKCLTALACRLADAPDRIVHLKTLLSFLSSQTRPNLLKDIQTLLPLLLAFGKDAMSETSQSINDVSRWWP